MSEMRRCRAQCAGNDAEVDTDLPGIITSARAEIMRSARFVCLSVCLSVGLRKKLCTDLHEIFATGSSWPSLKVISFRR